MKVICIHHRLAGFSSHHFNEAYGFLMEEVERLALIAEEPHVSVIREAMPLKDYQTALDSADIAIFPYEVIPYRKRISGVFAEAVAYGSRSSSRPAPGWRGKSRLAARPGRSPTTCVRTPSPGPLPDASRSWNRSNDPRKP